MSCLFASEQSYEGTFWPRVVRIARVLWGTYGTSETGTSSLLFCLFPGRNRSILAVGLGLLGNPWAGRMDMASVFAWRDLESLEWGKSFKGHLPSYCRCCILELLYRLRINLSNNVLASLSGIWCRSAGYKFDFFPNILYRQFCAALLGFKIGCLNACFLILC